MISNQNNDTNSIIRVKKNTVNISNSSGFNIRKSLCGQTEYGYYRDGLDTGQRELRGGMTCHSLSGDKQTCPYSRDDSVVVWGSVQYLSAE